MEEQEELQLMMEMFKKIVEEKTAVHMDSQLCQIFLSSHNDHCTGCESEKGCKALSQIHQVIQKCAFLIKLGVVGRKNVKLLTEAADNAIKIIVGGLETTAQPIPDKI